MAALPWAGLAGRARPPLLVPPRAAAAASDIGHAEHLAGCATGIPSLLAAAHGLDDAYPTLVTLHELREGVLTPEQLKHVREKGGLLLEVSLTTDAESVYKSLTSRDLKTPTEKTLLGHVSWIRELLQLGIVKTIRWCDTRDMTADGHTKGCIDRKLLLQVMSGMQKFQHAVKEHTPRRHGTTTTARGG